MRSLLISAVLLGAAFFGAAAGARAAFGQTERAVPHSPAADSASRASASPARAFHASAFQAEVSRELSGYAHGEWLYERCDAFSRWIDYSAERALRNSGNRSRSSTNVLSEQDAAITGDISRSADDEDEPSIAINRVNQNLIVAGANDLQWISGSLTNAGMNTEGMPAYVSTDAGNSWRTYRLPLDEAVPGAAEWGDPMIVCDNSGMFYYSFLMYPSVVGGNSDLVVARSTDGIHWSLGNPVINILNRPAAEDKETIAVDNDRASPYYGRLYIAWKEFYDSAGLSAPLMIHYIAHSDDRGITWSSPVRFTSYYGDFALLRVGYGGAVFIASMHYFDSVGDEAADMSHGLSVSLDGGTTFRDYPVQNFVNYPFVQTVHRDGLKGMFGFRAEPYPCFDVDSGNVLRLAYGTYDSLRDAAELYETTSTTMGTQWSVPRQIGTPSGAGNDHFLPWLATDPVTHATYVSLLSSEEDTLNLGSQAAWCNYSNPTVLVPMGSDLFDPLLLTESGIDFIGDYATSDAYNGYYAASWTENRQPAYHDGEIFAYVSSSMSNPGPDAVRAIDADEFSVGEFSPNPASGNSTSLTIASNAERIASVRVFDLKGNEIVDRSEAIHPSESNRLSVDIHALPAGVYRVLIQSGWDAVDRNLIVLR